ncbi:MAG: dihydroorotate dehydrogenase electron transfer subunit [Oscillospiraceae bacterium]|nr:dihydroorotate dehydrogenase electron transfer subunit [Oscillospiraceae bacterium]RKJ57140.1 dihydroorotate dehydrogenase electron transfer subunit [bacterium 1XD42-8]RKJ66227.1 dihydroorotate dehydrogenase electron transfer subunit [bacterium 1XD42-1]
MAYLQGSFPIIQKQQFNSDTYSFYIRCPEMAAQTVPGQFVNLKIPGFSLRRPISVCQRDDEVLRLVFQIRGEGTKELAALEPGMKADLLGPLGNGFPQLPPKAKVILAGGGIGVPPLLALAQVYGRNATALLGFRNKESLILEGEFAAECDTRVATDDGSFGYHGFVTGLLERRLSEGPADMIFACGPLAMLKGIADIAEKNQIPCKVSVEERMACGIGACLVCACRTVRDGKEIYSHVCTDGPVFDSREVVL